MIERPTAPLGYEILDKLDRGGMGVVYLARQVAADRVVALKMVRPDALDDCPEPVRRRLLERFLREAWATARLVHDHIVTVYDVGVVRAEGQAECRPFYAMEYIGGPSLAEVLQDGPMPPRRAAADLAALAGAAHYAHSEDILHRDIKPRNILIDAGGRPHLADFGLAKRLSAATGLSLPGDRLGTPAYMSPEQVRDPAEVGVRSDVYGLGSTFYAMLTGRPPFVGDDPVEVMHRVVHEEPAPPRRGDPRIPRDLETICLACLRKDPKDRYATAGELAEDLGRYLRGVPITRRRPNPAERAARFLKLHPTAAACTVAASIAVAAVLSARHREARTSADRAAMLVDAVRTSSYANLPAKISDLDRCRDEVAPLLIAAAADPDATRDEQLRANLALLPSDPARVANRVRESLYDCDPEAFPVALEYLGTFAPGTASRIWADWSDPKAGHNHRLRAACALAQLDPKADWGRHAPDVVLVLTSQNAADAGASIARLRPIGRHLLPELRKALHPARDRDRSRIALRALADYLPREDRRDELIQIVRQADPGQLRDIAAILKGLGGGAAVLGPLRETFASVPDADVEPVESVIARANAAVLLFLIGDPRPALESLAAGRDQTLRYSIIDRLGIAADRDFAAESGIHRLASDVPDDVLQGLLLALRGCSPTTSRSSRDPLIDLVATLYRSHPDPGVRSAAGWLLRQWSRETEVEEADLAETPAAAPRPGRRWFVGPEGHCFAAIQGPNSFESSQMMSVDHKQYPEVVVREGPVQAHLVHSFAIATREVSRGQMRRFRAAVACKAGKPPPVVVAPSEDDDLPESPIKHDEAVAYCRWLDGLLGPGHLGRRAPPGFGRSSSPGFRLPTAVEWEFAARGGSTTPRFFGRDVELLDRFSVFLATSKGRIKPTGTLWPNALGLFDIYGNVSELAIGSGITPRPLQSCGESASTVQILHSSVSVRMFSIRSQSYPTGLRIAITLAPTTVAAAESMTGAESSK